MEKKNLMIARSIILISFELKMNNTMNSRKVTRSNGRLKIDPREASRKKSQGSRNRRRKGDDKSMEKGNMGTVACLLEEAMSAVSDGAAANHNHTRRRAARRGSNALREILKSDPDLYFRLRKALDKERLKDRRSHHRSMENCSELQGLMCDESSITGPVQTIGGQRGKIIAKSSRPSRRSSQMNVEDTEGSKVADSDVGGDESISFLGGDSTPKARHYTTFPMSSYEVAPGWEDVLLDAASLELGVFTPRTVGGPFDLGYPDPAETARAQMEGSRLAWEKNNKPPTRSIWTLKAVQRQLEKDMEEEDVAFIAPGEDEAVDLEEAVFGG
jgi:hypothetical protein